MNDKERIEKEAKEFAGSVYKRNHFPVHWDKAFRGYIAGATAEHITARNKAIDEVQDLFKTKLLPIDPLAQNILKIAKAVSEIYEALEKLKSQPGAI